MQPEALHALIGREFSWKGERYHAIEILNIPLQIIAQRHDPHIQTDAHGRARRIVQNTIVSIPVLTSDGSHLHPDFLLISDWHANPSATLTKIVKPV